MQVSGSFLESRTAKIDAPAVSQRRSTLLSVAFARASAIGLPSPASFSHSHNKWQQRSHERNWLQI